MPGLGVPDTLANRHLLDYLRSFAMPMLRRNGEFAGWQLHTHPDLAEALSGIAGSRKQLVGVLGVMTIVHKEVIVAAALWTETLLFRLPEAPAGVLREPPIGDLEKAGWYAVAAFQPHLNASSSQGWVRMAELLQQARDHVRR